MLSKSEKHELEKRIIEEIKMIFDPEIPVNIYDIGLIYDINISDEGEIKILMTLTSPNCPVAESLPAEVKEKVKSVEGVRNVDLKLTFEPPWSMDLLSEEAKLELGFL
jgi:FeS assembly SUF system protein